MKTPTTTDAIAFRRSQDALQCDSVEPWQHGSVLRTPSVPNYWDVNAVRVEAADVSAPEMLAAADRYLADCAHRKLDIEDEATGAAARPFFDAAGWLTERHTMMGRVGPPPPVRHDVLEVPLSATRNLRTEWYGEHADEAFMAAQEPVLARRGMRAFMAGEDGYVMMAAGPGAVEIDALYVTERARGTGLGASLVAAALVAGGQDVGVDRRRRRRPRAAALRAAGLRHRVALLRLREAGLADSSPAGEVARAAAVAAEGGVGDDAGVPGERLVRGFLDREVGAPARALVIEVDELVEREDPPTRRRISFWITRVTRSRVGTCSGKASSRRCTPCAHCSRAVSYDDTARILVEPLHDVGPLTGFDHAEAAGLALDRAGSAQLRLARAEPLVLGAQLATASRWRAASLYVEIQVSAGPM